MDLMTLKKQCASLLKVQRQDTQNAVLLKELYDNFTEERLNKLKPSEFGNLPAATLEEASIAIQQLSMFFPKMPSTFFAMLAKFAVKKCLSKARIEYAVEWLLNNHNYPTFTLADFLNADKEIHWLTYEEAMSLEMPHKPLVTINFGNRIYTVYKEDAERCGYEYEPSLSPAEQRYYTQQAIDAKYRDSKSQTKVGDFDALMKKIFNRKS